MTRSQLVSILLKVPGHWGNVDEPQLLRQYLERKISIYNLYMYIQSCRSLTRSISRICIIIILTEVMENRLDEMNKTAMFRACLATVTHLSKR